MAKMSAPVGQIFGLWTVLGPSEKPRQWDCSCGCGRILSVFSGNLLSGKTRGCKSCQSTKRSHGMACSPTYVSWNKMIDRCCNPNSRSYHNYGGRGISVCSHWRKSFQNFLADMGARPSMRHSIERIDVNGNYEPGNCRWATSGEQARNKRTSVMVTSEGKTLCIMDWSLITGINYDTLWHRLRRGMTPDSGLFHPGKLKCGRKSRA